MEVGELDDVLEVLERGVAPAAVEVVDERRAVVGGEHRGVAADLHGVGRVAGVLHVLRRCGRDELAGEPAREPTRVPSTSAPASANRVNAVG